MTKRQGLLLAMVLASGSTLLTYIWYSGRSPSPAAAKSATPSRSEGNPVAIQAAGEKTTAGGYTVPRYQRAVAIEVDAATGAGSLAQSSDRVDVLLTASDTRAARLAETIIQDVPVIGPSAGQAAGAEPVVRDKKRQIVVAVSPQDAQRLMAAQLRGTLVVTLRNPTDREYAFVRPIANPQRPRPAPAAAARPAAPAAKAAAASAGRPPSRPARRYRRPVSMAAMGMPPEPLSLLAPPLPPPPSVRQVPMPAPPRAADAGPAPKTIEVVKGTAVQTVTVKE